MRCARNQTETFENNYMCTSETLQEWVFVALQYIVISKKLLICNYNTTKLRNLVRNLGKNTRQLLSVMNAPSIMNVLNK